MWSRCSQGAILGQRVLFGVRRQSEAATALWMAEIMSTLPSLKINQKRRRASLAALQSSRITPHLYFESRLPKAHEFRVKKSEFNWLCPKSQLSVYSRSLLRRSKMFIAPHHSRHSASLGAACKLNPLRHIALLRSAGQIKNARL
jgi:hypothetical protein